MHTFLVYLCAFGGPILLWYMFTRAEKIRNSKWWPLGCLLWIYACANTIGAWSVLMDQAGVELPPEEESVPIFFGIMMLMLLVVAYFNIYRPYRKHKKSIIHQDLLTTKYSSDVDFMDVPSCKCSSVRGMHYIGTSCSYCGTTVTQSLPPRKK